MVVDFFMLFFMFFLSAFGIFVCGGCRIIFGFKFHLCEVLEVEKSRKGRVYVCGPFVFVLCLFLNVLFCS